MRMFDECPDQGIWTSWLLAGASVRRVLLVVPNDSQPPTPSCRVSPPKPAAFSVPAASPVAFRSGSGTRDVADAYGVVVTTSRRSATTAPGGGRRGARGQGVTGSGAPGTPVLREPMGETVTVLVVKLGIPRHAIGLSVALGDRLATQLGRLDVIFDHIEWDEANLNHATVRATAAEIEQAIWNADSMTRHREQRDRVLFRAKTDGGRRLVVVAQIVRDGVRPITAWEEE